MASMPEDLYRPETSEDDESPAVLMITGNEVEDLEFFYPYYRFIEAGYEVDVATPDGKEFKGKHGLGLKQTKKIADIDSEDYDLLYLPGGKAPAQLKDNEDVIRITKDFMSEEKPISAICHGPQILAAAGVIKNHKIAAWPEVEDEVRQAGATYVNEETVVDAPFITARWPADLPAHMRATLGFMEEAA